MTMVKAAFAPLNAIARAQVFFETAMSSSIAFRTAFRVMGGKNLHFEPQHFESEAYFVLVALVREKVIYMMFEPCG